MLFKPASHIEKILLYFTSADREGNIAFVVYRLLRYFKLKVTYSTVSEYLKSHPDFPTLKSVCDFFGYFNITNYPLKLDKGDLYEIDRPFIAHLTERGGKVIIVYQINDRKVVYAESLYVRKSIALNEFLDKWEGVAIIIEPDNFSGDSEYQVKRNDEIIRNALVPFTFLILFITALLFFFNESNISGKNFSLSYFIICITHLVGLVFSILLFRHELEIKTRFTEKLCHISTNTDCNAVTKSKASKIFGSISWADAGIVYFTGGLVVLLGLPGANEISLLTILSICSIPYPIFSIFYQWLKLNKWCPLCLSVQLVLLAEFIVLIQDHKISDLNLPGSIHIFLIFSVVFIVTILMKYLIINEKEKDNLKLTLLKIKRNRVLFIQHLKKSERINLPVEGSAMVFGDLSSKVILTVFLSLYCSACSAKFDEIIKLIRKRIKIKIHLVFSPQMDELTVKLMKIILLVFMLNNRDLAADLLEKWYKADRKVKHTVLKGIRIPEFNEAYYDMISCNKKLFMIGNVRKVPSVFINGFPLPPIYSLDDIRFHLDTLKEMNKESVEMIFS